MEFKNLKEKLKFLLIPDCCIEDVTKDFYLIYPLRLKYMTDKNTYDFYNNSYCTSVEYLLEHPDLLDLMVETLEKRVVNPNKYKQINTQKMENKNNSQKLSSFDKMLNKIKASYLPEKESNLSLAIDGSICVKIEDSYIGFNSNNELIEYPEEMRMNIPMWSILKPLSQIKEGDIIKVNNSFYKITNLKNADKGKIGTISYKGTGHSIKEIKDFVINQSFYRVIINFNNFSFNNKFTSMEQNNMNPLLLIAMMGNEGEKSSNSLMKMMMVSQMMGKENSNMNFMNNPNMMMMLLANEGSDSNDFLKMIMMSQVMNTKIEK